MPDVVVPPRAPSGERRRPIVLVADPDADLAELTACGITVVHAGDGLEALLRIGMLSPDVVLLSARLPQVDAPAAIRALRTIYDSPIIIGAGAGDADIAVRALTAGATACVARPYRIQELLPLIDSAGTAHILQSLRSGDIELDVVGYILRRGGVEVHIPLREFELLRFLMTNSGRVVTREEIALAVWGSELGAQHNTIAVHIKRLRARLRDDERNPSIIHTIRGRGYRFTPPLD
ncbi:response regulator transcription factor [Sphaerisporangium sp. B11E5]|uniref:response regulator transcription factor n=1 Tax=Sphaerisporangium sp. B11E5 TaxID=3153563 RepID=UPI00325E281E